MSQHIFSQGEVLSAVNLNANFDELYGFYGPQEPIGVTTASGASGTIIFNYNDNVFIQYYSLASVSNFAVKFRGDASTTLNSLLVIGRSLTYVLLVTNGATGYYPNGFTVDNVAVVPKWVYGVSPTSGSTSAIDSYTFTLIKTADNAFTLLASQNKYA
jgi:hypothetical protein